MFFCYSHVHLLRAESFAVLTTNQIFTSTFIRGFHDITISLVADYDLICSLHKLDVEASYTHTEHGFCSNVVDIIGQKLLFKVQYFIHLEKCLMGIFKMNQQIENQINERNSWAFQERRLFAL